MQRRRLARLVVERQIEEFIERVVGLRPEPGEKFLAPAQGAQHMGEETERRQLARGLRQFIERAVGRGKSRIVAGLGAQGLRAASLCDSRPA